MPIYCYENKDGDVIERVYPVGKAEKGFKFKGEWYTRCIGAEIPSVPATKGWPIECIGSGVQPEQASELRELFKKSGVPTEVSRDGNPIYRDASHRKKALKCRGFFDRSSY